MVYSRKTRRGRGHKKGTRRQRGGTMTEASCKNRPHHMWTEYNGKLGCWNTHTLKEVTNTPKKGGNHPVPPSLRMGVGRNGLFTAPSPPKSPLKAKFSPRHVRHH